MAVNQWLEWYALRLRALGIWLEDYPGRDLPLVPVLEMCRLRKLLREELPKVKFTAFECLGVT